MNNLFLLDKIRKFSTQELALYLITVSIFLPFYLFLTLFFLYFVLLLLTGKLTPILKDIQNFPFLLGFIVYSAMISILARNWPGLIISFFFLLFYIFFRYYQRIVTPVLFHTIVQTFLFLSLVAVAFAFLEHYEVINKFNYSFLSPLLQRHHQNRAEVTFFNPNYYGLICCFCIMLGFYFIYISEDWKFKTFSFICCVLNAVGLNLTQNRAAFPAIICGALIYLFTTIKNSHAFLLSILFFVFAVYLLFSSNLGMRMGHVESSFDERVAIWQAAIQMLKMNKWFGHGPLTYMHSYQSVGVRYHEHAHSLYIDTLLSYGYVGVMLLLSSIASLVEPFVRSSKVMTKRPIVGLILSFFVVVAVHGIFDLAIFWIQTAFVFLIVITTIPLWAKELEGKTQ